MCSCRIYASRHLSPPDQCLRWGEIIVLPLPQTGVGFRRSTSRQDQLGGCATSVGRIHVRGGREREAVEAAPRPRGFSRPTRPRAAATACGPGFALLCDLLPARLASQELDKMVALFPPIKASAASLHAPLQICSSAPASSVLRTRADQLVLDRTGALLAAVQVGAPGRVRPAQDPHQAVRQPECESVSVRRAALPTFGAEGAQSILGD